MIIDIAYRKHFDYNITIYCVLERTMPTYTKTVFKVSLLIGVFLLQLGAMGVQNNLNTDSPGRFFVCFLFEYFKVSLTYIVNSSAITKSTKDVIHTNHLSVTPKEVQMRYLILLGTIKKK